MIKQHYKYIDKIKGYEQNLETKNRALNIKVGKNWSSVIIILMNILIVLTK